MTPTPTASLMGSLDPRASIARTSAVDAVRPLDPSARDAGASFDATRMPSMPKASAAALAFAARWPVGSDVLARVVSIAEDRRITADVDGLPIEIRWRDGDGPSPRAGEGLAFRVMAHTPQLVLQFTAHASFDAPSRMLADRDAPTQLSDDALFLQTLIDPLEDAADASDRVVRFAQPLIETRRPGVAREHVRAMAGHVASLASDASATMHESIDHLASHVFAAKHDAGAGAMPFIPVVLSGPAWHGQAMELLLRRHARDDALDDPALDAWCGEITMDLPRLGRVAGHLALSMQGVRLRLEADDVDGAVALDAALSELAAAFADTGLRLASLSVGGPPGLASPRPLHLR